MFQWLTQDASRQDVTISEGIGAIDEDDVDIAIKLPVLEAVIEDENLGVEFFDGHAAADGPVSTDEDGNAHELLAMRLASSPPSSAVRSTMRPSDMTEAPLFSRFE